MGMCEAGLSPGHPNPWNSVSECFPNRAGFGDAGSLRPAACEMSWELGQIFRENK
jgi:hypothetical protein